VAIISFRLDKAEMRAIRAEASARGFTYISELVREKMGLQPGVGRTAPSPAMERIDAEVHDPVVAGVLRELVDRSDMMIRVINGVARHVGVPREVAERSPAHDPKPDPVAAEGFER
jgi:hypothetical protein